MHTENTHVRITNSAQWSPQQKMRRSNFLLYFLPHEGLTSFYSYPLVNNFRDERCMSIFRLFIFRYIKALSTLKYLNLYPHKKMHIKCAQLKFFAYAHKYIYSKQQVK